MRTRKAVTDRLLLRFLAGVLFCAFSPGVRAQTESPYRIRVESNMVQAPIHVESNLVVVRAMVVDKKLWARGWSQAKEKRCEESAWENYRGLPASEPYFPSKCYEFLVRGLRANDFHVFVDGTQQKIQKVLVESLAINVRDNYGKHDETFNAPAGEWITADLPERMGFLPGGDLYDISFVPGKSEAVGCHNLIIKVDRPHAEVFARRRYCASQPPSDILNGTEFGKQMERDLASAEPGKLHMSLQAGFFYTEPDHARVHIALEFPWDSLDRKWQTDRRLHATIGVTGMIYKKDGSLAARFSDFGCCSADSSRFAVGWGSIPYAYLDRFGYYDNGSGELIDPQSARLSLGDVKVIPTRYETQIELPSGEYDLRVVLSDGLNFARAEMPLNIENYDGKELALSSILLCKRFRNAAVAAQETAAANFAPQYVPLVSKGMWVNPAADTLFKPGEPLIAYFEIYDPLLATQPGTTVEAHMRIVDTNTGELKKGFPPVDARPYERPGGMVMPVAPEIFVDNLPQGSYRLEVQASDSAGRSTPWRTASFSCE